MHVVEEEANRLPFTVEKGDYGVLESGAILILSAVDWMSTEKRVRND